MVSVIVPARNVAAYIGLCLESLVRQSHRELEIIVVEDDSGDGTGAALAAWAKKDGRIRLERGPGMGQGAARQRGLELARGAYVAFVDGDDYLATPYSLEALVRSMDVSGADIAQGNYLCRLGERTLSARRHGWLGQPDREGRDFRFQAFFSKGHLAYVWGKMYKRAFLQSAGITFSHLPYAEDRLFNYLCYGHGAKYVFLEENVYVYRRNAHSISSAYRRQSWEIWMALAGAWEEAVGLGNWPEAWLDMAIYMLPFALFFDGKMEYAHNPGFAGLQAVVKAYQRHGRARGYGRALAEGRCLSGLDSRPWRTALRGFGLIFSRMPAWFVALGIWMLDRGAVDRRLSALGGQND